MSSPKIRTRLCEEAVFEKRPARNRSRIELLMMKITTKTQ